MMIIGDCQRVSIIGGARVVRKCTVMISDLHLGDVRWTPERYSLLINFLNEFVVRNAERLVIAGDLLEWLQYEIRSLGRAKDVIFLLQSLPMKGIEVIYVVGNHDLDMCLMAAKEMPAPIIYPRLHLDLYGASVHVEHGHFYDATVQAVPGAAAFFAKWGGLALDAAGPRLEDALGAFKDALMGTKPRTTGQSGQALEQHDCYTRAATKLAVNGDHDIVVFGHTHRALTQELRCARRSAKKMLYVNTGDWQVHSDFVVFTQDGKVSLESWERIAAPIRVLKR